MKGSKFILLLFCLLFGFTTLKALDSLGTINLVGKLYDYWGTARSIAFRDTFAFVATSGAGLRVVVVSQPDSMYELSYYYTENSRIYYDIALSSDYGLVVTDNESQGGGNLLIFDLSDPINPIPISKTPISTPLAKVIAVDHYAYVAEEKNGLRVFDITDPLMPHELSLTGYPKGSIYGFCLNRNFAFVAIYNLGVMVIDLSNPEIPTVIDTLQADKSVRSLVVSNDTLFVAGQKLHIYDLTHLPDIKLIGEYLAEKRLLGVIVSGDFAVIKLDGGTLVSLDITDPAAPIERGRAPKEPDSFSTCRLLYLHQNTVYNFHELHGLQTFNFQDPQNPRFMGKFNQCGPLCAVDVLGDYAYIRNQVQGMLIVDVSDPSNPREVGRLELDEKDYGGEMVVNNGFAYLVNYLHGIDVIDVTNPQQPQYVRLVEGYPGGKELVIMGEVLLMSSDSTFLDIFDISTPNAPEHRSSFDIGLQSDGIATNGNYAYVSDRIDGILIINASDPTLPRVERFYNPFGKGGESITIDEEHKLACWNCTRENGYGTAILDISEPLNPVFLGIIPKVWGGAGEIADSHFVAVGANSMITVYDIRNPKQPYKTGQLSKPDIYLRDFTTHGEKFYVAGARQFLIYDMSEPLPVFIADASVPANPSFNFYPNPTNGSLRIDYRLSAPGKAGLALYDLRGCLVEEIMSNTHQSAGEHQIQWSPGELPSGQYFLKFDGNGTSSNQTITILK